MGDKSNKFNKNHDLYFNKLLLFIQLFYNLL